MICGLNFFLSYREERREIICGLNIFLSYVKKGNLWFKLYFPIGRKVICGLNFTFLLDEER